jgi:CRP-like cAMP-binding protein
MKEYFVGDSFGQQALVQDTHLREDSVVAKEYCVLATLSTQDYISYLKHIKDKKEEHMVKWLRATAFFGKWSRSLLIKLIASMTQVTVHRGTSMVYEGENCQQFFIIYDGEFAVTKKVTKSPKVTVDHQFMLLGKGQTFAEEVVLN